MADPSRPFESLEQAVRGMQSLKAEHRELLERIASDAGMEPETRRALITHVLEEEDEKLARIAELTGSSAPAPTPSPAPSGRARLSVGSLRAPDDRPRSHRGSIGSLRND